MSDSFNPHRVRTVRGCVHRECDAHTRYARFSQSVSFEDDDGRAQAGESTPFVERLCLATTTETRGRRPTDCQAPGSRSRSSQRTTTARPARQLPEQRFSTWLLSQEHRENIVQ